MTLEPGLEATFRHTVTEADTAAAVGSGEVPVLATPRCSPSPSERPGADSPPSCADAGSRPIGALLAGREAADGPGPPGAAA
jgi:hypothetical protein